MEDYKCETGARGRERHRDEEFAPEQQRSDPSTEISARRSRRYTGAVAVISNSIFAIILSALVCSWWSPSPYYDQWDYEGDTLIRYFAHTLSWSVLFAQHNESHLLVPRLVALLYAPILGWDIRFEVALTLLCAILTSAGLTLLILRNESLTKAQQICCCIAANATVLCCVQYVVLLFGAYYFIIPGMSLVWSLVVAGTRWHYRFKIATWIALILLAMFSYTPGTMLWFLLLPTMRIEGRRTNVARNSRFVLQGIYCLVGLATLTYYFATYKHPPNTPGTSETFIQPWRMLTYFVYWIGAPFAHVGVPALSHGILGITFLVLLLAPSLYLLFIYRKNIVDSDCYEWLLISTYVVLVGLLITVGRSGLGDETALISRYQTFSLLLLATCAPLAFLAANHYLTTHVSQRLQVTTAYSFIAGAMSLLYVLNFYFGSIELANYGVMLNKCTLTVEFINVIPDNANILLDFPRPGDAVKMARLLEPHHLPRISMGAEQIVSSARTVTLTGDGTNGFLDSVTQGNGMLSISGWAILKDRGKPTGTVLIEWRGLDGSVKAISVTAANDARPVVAKALNHKRFLQCGFSDFISTANIPGPGIISAWAVDTQKRKAYQLGNTKPVTL